MFSSWQRKRSFRGDMTQELAVHSKAGSGLAELVPTWMPIWAFPIVCCQLVLGAADPGDPGNPGNPGDLETSPRWS